jgi:hypothetical protein
MKQVKRSENRLTVLWAYGILKLVGDMAH